MSNRARKNVRANATEIEGVSTISGGVYEDITIDGICTVRGDLEASEFDVDGVCTCEGNLKCKKLDCDGVFTIHGDVRAEKADIKGVLTVNGNHFEAEVIVCDGVISIDGEISADVIRSDGFITANEIVGDDISIKSYRKVKILEIFMPRKLKYSKVDLIEATTIYLRDVRAKKVSGHDVVIDKGCDIEVVDCTGKLKVDPDSRVGSYA